MTAGASCEPTGPDEPFATALARLRVAMADVANGNVAAIKALHSDTDDVTSFYGWGGFEKGADAVARRWDWAAEQFKGGSVSYRNVSTVVGADIAYVTDLETFRVSVNGLEAPKEWTNRVTHIFRLESGRWRLLHRHGNRLEGQFEPRTRLK